MILLTTALGLVGMMGGAELFARMNGVPRK